MVDPVSVLLMLVRPLSGNVLRRLSFNVSVEVFATVSAEVVAVRRIPGYNYEKTERLDSKTIRSASVLSVACERPSCSVECTEFRQAARHGRYPQLKKCR